ncbi:MAG: MarR family transcriptional regulator [Candidatus Limnocylindrales bacterium]
MTESDVNEESSPSIFFEVYALGQEIRELLASAMADSPLTPVEYAIYSAIFEDERVTPTRLARRLGVALTTAMDHVARLEARGHARRSADPRDRRATLVTLTGHGLAAHRAANAYFELAYAAFVGTLTTEEGSATRVLRALRAAVRSARQSLPAGVGNEAANHLVTFQSGPKAQDDVTLGGMQRQHRL